MNNDILAYIRIAKVGYTRLLWYTDYIDKGHSKDGTIGEEHSDFIPLLIQKVVGMRI